MNYVVEEDGKGLFVCGECKLKYSDKQTAEKCEKWCSTYKSCNLEIIKKAVVT